MFRTGLKRTTTTVIALASLIMFNVLPASALSFTDISQYWARDSILRLASMEIVSGFNGKFNPKAGVTRAEFAAMIVKAVGLADEADAVRGSATGYHDVSSSHWASGFIVTAREAGIISGYPDATFRPSALITRAEITSVLVRALSFSPESAMSNPRYIFTDGEKIQDWALNSVKAAFGYGLVSGYPDGTFRPASNATRGETAALVERVLQQLGAHFTFYGKLLKIESAGSSMTLEIESQVATFRVISGAQVRVNGVPKAVEDLKLLSNLFVNVDDDGNITFIQVDDSFKKTSFGPEPVQVTTASYRTVTNNLPGKSSDALIPVIFTAVEGAALELTKLIQAGGGTIKLVNEEIDWIAATVPEGLLELLRSNPLVEEVLPDLEVRVGSSGSPEGVVGPAAIASNPGVSLNVSKEIVNSPLFVNQTGSDGKNQRIAIIDTGIDAGHPDLLVTSDGNRKIVDWQDFTGEGDIETGSTAAVNGRNVYLPTGTHYLGSISSAGGVVKYGYLRESDFVNLGGIGLDLNFNGVESDIFGVIVVDSRKAGVYDTVYVDTDRDNVFAEETPLLAFSTSGNFATFSDEEGLNSLNFVLTTIGPGGAKVNLGFVFDANDHGTHVAGIASANGQVKGVAPGSQLMAIKVLDSAGYGKLSTIIEAITYAASHGATIINLSLSFAADDSGDNSIPVKILNSLSEKYGVLFVTAVGNFGPGLNTVASPGSADTLISVGAFSSPGMWKIDYGWDVAQESVWFFSAAGPRKDGAISPSVVAPGSAVSTGPLRKGEKYFLSEGTSMAVPYVSGAAALLMEGAQRSGLKVSPVIVKKAIESGARPIPGHSPVDQGYGALDLLKSWKQLQSYQDSPKISVYTAMPRGGMGAGMYFREDNPGRTTLYLQNMSDKPSTLKLAGGSWFTPVQDTVTIPAGKTRAVDVNFTLPQEKGLHSGFVTGEDSAYGTDLQVLTTAINPYGLSKENNYSRSFSNALGPAQYTRYFIKLPAGADELQAQLTVPGGQGRAKMYMFNPSGKLVAENGELFAGVDRGTKRDSVSLKAQYPGAGVWEIVVYSSAALSTYGLQKSSFSLDVSLSGSSLGLFQQENRNIIVGVVPKLLKVGRKNYLTIQVRDKATKRPYQGFVEVFGHIYFTRGGRVVVPVEAVQGNTSVVVSTVPTGPGYKPWQFTFNVPAE